MLNERGFSMITHICLEGFGSLGSFKCKLGKFNCLIGFNDVGKTQIIKAIELLNCFVSGDVEKSKELQKKYLWTCNTQKGEIRYVMRFTVQFLFGCDAVRWVGVFDFQKGYCTSEHVNVLTISDITHNLLSVVRGTCSFDAGEYTSLYFEHQGSLMSQLKCSFIKQFPLLHKVRDFMLGIQTIDFQFPIMKGEVCGSGVLYLMDEVENGLHHEVIEERMDVLVNSDSQVIVTTYSPMVLNYLEDKVAVKSVLLMYEDENHNTKLSPYFDDPVTLKKLDVLGPGEVYIDTYDTDVIDRFNTMDRF